MPSPTRRFHEVAARYGGVDPRDTEAVQQWFTQVLPTLSVATVEEILELLLRSVEEQRIDPESPIDVEPEPCYPEDATLPCLSESPPAPIPGWAVGRRVSLPRFLGVLFGPSKRD